MYYSDRCFVYKVIVMFLLVIYYLLSYLNFDCFEFFVYKFYKSDYINRY